MHNNFAKSTIQKQLAKTKEIKFKMRFIISFAVLAIICSAFAGLADCAWLNLDPNIPVQLTVPVRVGSPGSPSFPISPNTNAEKSPP